MASVWPPYPIAKTYERHADSNQFLSDIPAATLMMMYVSRQPPWKDFFPSFQWDVLFLVVMSTVSVDDGLYLLCKLCSDHGFISRMILQKQLLLIWGYQ